MTYKVIKVEKALNLEDLKKKPAPRNQVNPRDEELAKLVKEVAVGPKSQVIPWRFDGKPATARLAARKAIERAALVGTVFVSSRPDHPGLLLFSREPLSGRQGPKKKA